MRPLWIRVIFFVPMPKNDYQSIPVVNETEMCVTDCPTIHQHIQQLRMAHRHSFDSTTSPALKQKLKIRIPTAFIHAFKMRYTKLVCDRFRITICFTFFILQSPRFPIMKVSKRYKSCRVFNVRQPGSSRPSGICILSSINLHGWRSAKLV